MKNLKVWGLGLLTFSLLGMNVAAEEESCGLQSQIDSATAGATVQLAKSCAEDITINKEITLDLNGYTMSSHSVAVEGEGALTVKDSQSNGKITATNLPVGAGALVNVGGKFTLESGTVENTRGAGVFVDGGEVVVNGGTLTSFYAPLSGNNTKGTMIFKVNGGTITASSGPAIYMPGPISLDVKGGTINGGISLRMGRVNIEGGVINATTADIDEFEVEYASNIICLADGIAILAGAYTSNASNYTNVLDVNITGGTINVTNGKGSAVAVYDYAKVAQNASVKISGSAVLNTNSTTRHAYDVLTFDDFEIPNLSDAYNKEDLVGKISTAITGGTFSDDEALKFVQEGFEMTEKDGKYVVSEIKEDEEEENPSIEVDVTIPDAVKEQKDKDISVGVKDAEEAKKAIEETLSKMEEELAEYEDINVTVEIENQTKEDIEEAVLKAIDETVEKNIKGGNLLGYFDISINVKNGDELVGNLDELGSKIKLNVLLPKEIKAVEEGYTRTYYVIRYHGDKAEILSASLLEDGKTVEFESDKFSTYALAYKDSKEESDVPKTLDSVVGYAAFAGIALAGVVAAKMYLKKRN